MRLSYLLLVLATIFFMDASSEDSQDLRMTVEKIKEFINSRSSNLTSLTTDHRMTAEKKLEELINLVNSSLTSLTTELTNGSLTVEKMESNESPRTLESINQRIRDITRYFYVLGITAIEVAEEFLNLVKSSLTLATDLGKTAINEAYEFIKLVYSNLKTNTIVVWMTAIEAAKQFVNLVKSSLTPHTTNLLMNVKEQINEAVKAVNLSLTPQTAVHLVMQHGYKIQTHIVNVNVSKLNYTLELHRITGRANSTHSNVKKPVAFVMHGILCSSICWIIPGPGKGLAYVLAEAGYDVWLGNTRGNTYSHKIVDPDDKYWDFSFHEIGMYDLPAMIDYIVQNTSEKMFYLGHSQGTTAFFVMSAEQPKFVQDNIRAMFAMAPVAFCGKMESPILRFLAGRANHIYKLLKLLGLYKFPSDNIMYLKWICLLPLGKENKLMPLCSKVMLFLLAGFSKDQIEPKLLSSILEHFPADISIKQLVHYAQLIDSGKFSQFDYSPENLKKYNATSPPEYNLTRIKVPVLLHYATNDWLANTEDVEKLKENLTPSESIRVEDENFGHLDFMWAKDVNELLYNKTLNQMSRFQH